PRLDELRHLTSRRPRRGHGAGLLHQTRLLTRRSLVRVEHLVVVVLELGPELGVAAHADDLEVADAVVELVAVLVVDGQVARRAVHRSPHDAVRVAEAAEQADLPVAGVRNPPDPWPPVWGEDHAGIGVHADRL